MQSRTILYTALLLSLGGCGSGGSSDSPDTQSSPVTVADPAAPGTDVTVPPVTGNPANPDPADPDPINPDPTNPDPANPDPANPDPINPDPANPDPADPDPADPDPENPDPIDPDPANPDPAVPDPMNPVTTEVTFDITVPAVMSDTLKVVIFRDGITTDAAWNGDESWSATVAYPTDTRERLSIVFSSRNGRLRLGSIEEQFKTGTNAAETFTVTADRFFTAWDDDRDGTSNLDELRAGTDPSFDEASDDPIRDAFRISGLEEVDEAIRDVSGFFEAILPEQRPYFVQSEMSVDYSTDPYTEGLMETILIDIDASGTGAYSDVFERTDQDTNRRDRKNATRVATGDAIAWTGSYFYSDSSSGLVNEFEFSTETRAIDTGTLVQTGTIDKDSFGDVSGSNRPITIEYTLSTARTDGLQTCGALSGTIAYDTVTYTRDDPDTPVETDTVIRKEDGERYWTVTEASPDGTVFDTYSTPSLGLETFCDFADL